MQWYRFLFVFILAIGNNALCAQEHIQLRNRPNDVRIDSAGLRKMVDQAELLLVSDLDSAYQILQKTYVLSEEGQFTEISTRILALLSTYYFRLGEIEKSNSFLERSIQRAELLPDKTLLVYLHNAAGLMCLEREAPSSAITHFFKAQELVRTYNLQNTVHAVATYNNLGSLWLDLNEWSQALTLLDLAEANITDTNSARSYAYILTNKGLAYLRTDTAKAMSNFLAALDIVRRKKDEYAAHTILINISTLFMEAGDFDRAFYYLNEARISDELLGSEAYHAVTEGQMGLLYYQTKNYSAAEKHFTTALNLGKRTGKRLVVRGAYKALATLYATMGRFEDAYKHQEYYVAYLDSLQDVEKGKTVELALQYQALEKDKAIAEQQLLLSRKEHLLKQKNIWIALVICGAMLLLGLLILLNRNYRNKRKLAQERLQNLAQQQEIENLKARAEGEERERSRIAYDLHDGVMVQFATVKMQLNSLFESYPDLANDERHKQLMEQFDQATGELRRTAHNLMPDLLLEEGLIQALFYFCKAIEGISGLHIIFQRYGDLPRLKPEVENALYRIVQELVQNIVKHASAKEAVLQLNHEEGLLSITIEDNGSGFDVSCHANGMGLAGVRNRVRIYGGTFDLQSEPGAGTTIFLEFETAALLLQE